MNYTDIEKSLNETIEYYTDRISLWENVTFPTKKDGSPFKVLSRNIAGAEIGKYYPVEDWSHPYLTVSGRPGKKWISDEIPIIYDRNFYKFLPEDNENREDRRTPWGTVNHVLTLDEIKQAVSHTIDEYKQLKAQAEESLANSKESFEFVSEKLNEIKTYINNGDNRYRRRTPLQNVLEEYVRDFRLW